MRVATTSASELSDNVEVSIAIDSVEMRPSPIAALSSQRRSALTEHACSSAPAGVDVAIGFWKRRLVITVPGKNRGMWSESADRRRRERFVLVSWEVLSKDRVALRGEDEVALSEAIDLVGPDINAYPAPR